MNSPSLIGKRFHRCLVIGEAPRGIHKNTRWEILCDCGNHKIVYGFHLTNGHTKSCGCLQREGIANRSKRRPYEFLFNILKHNAQVAQRECDITYNDFVQFTSTTKCHYCGDTIIWNPRRMRKKNYAAAYHLDRKDNYLGYTKDNRVVCCSLCNSTKTNQFSYEEMCEIGKVIGEIKRRRILNGTITPKS